MKIFILIMTTLLCHASASSYSQAITFKKDNATIEQAFDEITKQTGFKVICEGSLVSLAKPQKVNFKNADIRTVLQKFFDKQPLGYEIIDNSIVIKLNQKTVAPLLVQEREIQGIVSDSTGVLPGVSVVVKGTKIGATTNLNGKFAVKIPGDNAILVFTMVGYQTQEVPVGKETEINVRLLPVISGLDEVVVVGFGKQKRTDMIGSVVSIRPESLKVPSSNLTTALAGRVAGMIAFQRSGEPGQDNAEFFIRGVTTFGYKVDPLILIDNVEVTTTDLARLQVDDIASFSIMKDATATAVYGARGANGVILITTKEGKEGPARISLRVENSVSRPTSEVELADPVTYMKLNNEAISTRDPLGALLYSTEKIANTGQPGSDPYAYPSTDWKKLLLKDYTMNQRANLNVSGGGDVAKYFVSGGYNKDNGILKVAQQSNFNNNIDLKSYSLRANVNINLSKTSELLVRLNGSFDDYSGPIDGGSKVYNDIMHSNPVLFPAYYPAGEKYKYVQHMLFGNFGDGSYKNPYADMVKGYKDYSRSMMLAQLEFKQNLGALVDGLSVRALVNTTRNSFFDVARQYKPFYYAYAGQDLGNGENVYEPLNETAATEYLDYAEGTKTVSSVFYMESSLNYNKTFKEKHNVSGMAVFILRNRLDGNAGDLQTSLPYRNVGVSGRFTYSYDNRYFSEFNFGYNGSERFYTNHRWGFFPSVGLAWSASNEKFMKPLSNVISNLRFRGTYGIVGNDAIGDASTRFFFLSNMNMNNTALKAVFGRDQGSSLNGISVTRYPNTDITWERGYKANLAMELGLFNKAKIVVDAFREDRKNILMPRASIPTTMGLVADVYANIGEALIKGCEVSGEYTHNISNDLWLQGMANFTFSTNKYLMYEEPEYSEPWLSRIGTPINLMRGLVAERLFVDDEEVANYPRQEFGDVRGGDIKYRDINGDGKITNLDKVPMGYPTVPEIVYGFGFSAGYKSVDFSAFFQGVARESFFIDAEGSAPFVGDRQLLNAIANDVWTEDNRNIYALWPRLSSTLNENNTQLSTWFLRNGAFLRLKQVEAGYTLPKKLSSKLKIAKARAYINGTNLFLLSGFKLWDVEQAGSNPFGYPVQSVYNLGVQLSF